MGRLRTAAALLAAGLLSALGAQAAPKFGPAPSVTPSAPTPLSSPPVAPAPLGVGGDVARPLTAPDLEAWLDGFMPYALESGDVAGAVVVVVKDGQTLLQKGYGYSDVAKRTPVDPATTLFRPGSTSKLFTWTAVMQQVERGKVNLDADINTYLDFKMPPGPGGKPITMRDVMTHTAGFEEAVKGLIDDDPTRLKTLEQALKSWTPTRIYPAGTTPAYSNYATALAGYVVQRVSGQDFDSYIEQNIFRPLGMTHATFRQPLPANLVPFMSKGYNRASSGEAKPFELIPLAPAGAMSASGQDMAAFMIAHLQDGEYRGQRILAPETARMMHDTTRTLLPPLNRMALGFYEQNVNGRRVISHGGDTQWFHTELYLYLDDNVGLYVSVNSEGREGAAGPIRMALFREFSNRYLPGPNPTAQVDAKTAAEHAKMIAGTYDNSRRVETSLVSLANLLGATKIVPNKDGTISVSIWRNGSGALRKYREITPFLWYEVGGDSRLGAVVEGGKVVRWSIDEFSPFMVFTPEHPAKASSWLVPAVGASLAILLLTLVLWPVTAIVRWRMGAPFPLAGQERRAYRLVRIAALASAGTILAWFGTVMAMFADLTLLNGGLDPVLWLLHIVGSIAVLGAVLVAGWNVWVVWRGQRSWFAKLWSALILISTVILAYLAVAYHLVGWGVNF
ncbi:serine hydrolase [Phenylobacterium sp.]|uniref:serine hydrolase n=1 Tax=Phenylobacterium sp. TaxID=1871053 RepID=UPI0035B234DC